MSTPRIIPGSIAHLHAARAKLGIAAGNNVDPTSEWYDLSGLGNHGALTNFAYEAGNRPRTNAETDKAKWHDLSGLGNDGTLTGFGFTTASGWATEPDRLVFDGTNDYVALPYLGAAEDKTSTLESWVNVPASITAPSSYATLIDESNDAASTPAARSQLNGPGGYARMAFNDGGWRVCTGSTDLRGGIHHVVGVVDGSHVRLYIDGDAEGAAAVVGAGGMGTLGYATVGASRYGGSPNGAHFSDLEHLADRIYPFALTPAQVAQNNAAGPTGTGYVRDGLVLDFNAARAVRPSGWVDL